MILFHVNITSMFPLAVPLEWNLFMIFGLLFLFGHYGDMPLSTIGDPLLIAVLAVPCLLLPLLGGTSAGQDLVPAVDALLRGELGDHAPGCSARAVGRRRSSTPTSRSRRGSSSSRSGTSTTGRRPSYLLNQGLAFRAMHSHGRALNALLPHAADDVENYDVREGELISNVVNGWNFGDAHFHGAQLLEAVQERCGFAAGDVRVVYLESEPTSAAGPALQVWDPVDGLLEQGSVAVKDMVTSQPWLDESFDFPVAVDRRRGSASEVGRSRRVVEQRDRRRLGPQRARLCRGAGPRMEWR